MFKKVPLSDYLPNQVIFIKDNKQILKPAKIIIKSSYGTYKVKIYGIKDQQYVSQYLIQPYTIQKAEQIQQANKKNKKLIKFLKTALKDFNNFQQKIPEIKIARLCKQQQQDLDSEQNDGQKGFQNIHTKYEAILNIKIQNLIADHNLSKDTMFSYNFKGVQRIFKQKPKWLIIQKLIWALEDITFGRSTLNTEIVISQIMDSNIIQPVEYLQTCLFKKLSIAIQYLKKNKVTKLKNFLLTKQSIIVSGIDNYLNNYSLFLRVREGFVKFLTGNQVKQQEQEQKMNPQENQSFPQLNLTK